MNGELLAGRYRLLTLLGRGGAGEVWRAEDTVLARPVAVKLLRRLDGDPMDSVQRFRIEAQAAARLMHPNVVATYDVGATADQVFLVMELIDGPDLAQLMRSAGLPTGKLVADIAVQGARALDAAHAAGLVHRDVKPGNLLLAADGTLKITDFGIAKGIGSEATGVGVLLGTASYVAPEQVRGEPATPASDWYALGCVLYELLAGRPPFTGDSVEAVMRQHLDASPDPALVRRPDVSPGLAALVMRLLAKDPAARPASAAEVTAQINRPEQDNSTRVLSILPVADSLSVADRPLDPADGDQPPEAPRRGLPFAKAIVAVAVVLAGVVVAALLREGVSDPTAKAGGVPTPGPASSSTVRPKPTTTPSKTPTTTPKPKTTPSAPRTAGPAELQALATLLRAGYHGKAGRTAREAAKDVDAAAEALAEGDTEKAADKLRDARQRLAEAQREDRWQPTPEISALLISLSRALPRSEQNNNSDE